MKLGARWIVASLLATGLTTSALIAQTSLTDDSKRKVKSKILPTYPELARRMNVTGKVRIEIIITPDGKVRSTRVVGGHPLLVQSAQDAVKEWKFVAGPEETTMTVEFEFHGAN